MQAQQDVVVRGASQRVMKGGVFLDKGPAVVDALALSLNTAAVRLLQQAGGPRAVASEAARLGIADRLPNDASLALGTGEVGLLELAASYAAYRATATARRSLEGSGAGS